MADSTTHDARETGKGSAPIATPPRWTHNHVPVLLATERRVLELVARGQPLVEALDALTGAIEALAPGMLASLLRLDPDGMHLRHGSARSLPATYCAAIDGVRIGPSAGSCGTAAFEGQVVVATDIALDPRWAAWRDLALRHGLRACWSAPIFSTSGRVLGTFALYYRQPGSPEREHLELIEGAAHVASVAIERHQLDEQRLTMIDDLSRAVRVSEMFAAVLGHDLRNPLSAISTAARMVQRNTSPESVARNADRILGCSARMNTMIEQLLDMTRIRLGRGLPIAPEPLDLVDVCRYAADELGAGGGEGDQRRQVDVQHAGDTRGYWDKERLLQIISNLVGNAFQHGAAGPPVVVRADGTQAEQVSVQVVNAGEMAPAAMKDPFDPFRGRGEPATSRQGLGLGLFISQQIATAHGGSIDVTSGGGTTTFTLRVPRGQAASALAPVVSFEPVRPSDGSD